MGIKALKTPENARKRRKLPKIAKNIDKIYIFLFHFQYVTYVCVSIIKLKNQNEQG